MPQKILPDNTAQQEKAFYQHLVALVQGCHLLLTQYIANSILYLESAYTDKDFSKYKILNGQLRNLDSLTKSPTSEPSLFCRTVSKIPWAWETPYYKLLKKIPGHLRAHHVTSVDAKRVLWQWDTLNRDLIYTFFFTTSLQGHPRLIFEALELFLQQRKVLSNFIEQIQPASPDYLDL